MSQERKIDSPCAKVVIIEEIVLPTNDVITKALVVRKLKHRFENPFDIFCEAEDMFVRDSTSILSSLTKNIKFKFPFGTKSQKKDRRIQIFSRKFRGVNALFCVIYYYPQRLLFEV